MLLWEISSGQPPFYIPDEQYGVDLAIEISQGLREKPISDTPESYWKIYTGIYKFNYIVNLIIIYKY